MKLFFDARYTRIDIHDGISRYSVELGNALASLPIDMTFLISDDRQKKWYPRHANFLRIHTVTSIKEPFTAFILNKYAPDIVYSPMQTIGTIGRRYISILTIHDMIYYRHPYAPKSLPFLVRVGWWLYHQWYWPERLLLRGGDIITTVSHTSAKEIRQARLTNKPLHIIHNAPQTFPRHQIDYHTPVEHLIYMGSFMPYKNVETLVKGMQWLPGRTLHLLSSITSDRRLELEKIAPKNRSIMFHNGVSDKEYQELLALNAALVSASFDEGFGIPIAEAMAIGTPVVISDIPVFHEVAGKGALYFKAASPQAFARQVRKLDSPVVRKRLTNVALRHVSQFQWPTSARTLLDVITSYKRP